MFEISKFRYCVLHLPNKRVDFENTNKNKEKLQKIFTTVSRFSEKLKMSSNRRHSLRSSARKSLVSGNRSGLLKAALTKNLTFNETPNTSSSMNNTAFEIEKIKAQHQKMRVRSEFYIYQSLQPGCTYKCLLLPGYSKDCVGRKTSFRGFGQPSACRC